MAKILTIERRNEIVNEIKKHGKISVVEAAKKFDVSMEMIRKDLAYLDDRGIVIKVHGGAILASKGFDHSVNVKLNENNELKKPVANKVVSLLASNSTIYLGAGSTQVHIAELLNQMSGFTIVTTSVPVCSALIDGDNIVMMAGGRLDKHNCATTGYWAMNAIHSMYFDYAIFGSSGMRNLEGPSTYSYEEMEIEKEVMKKSYKKIVACDSSKFNSTSIFQFANWEDIDLLVTNKEAEIGDIANVVEVMQV